MLEVSKRLDDAELLDLLRRVDAVTGALNIPFFVVGATARDLVLWYGHEIRPARATVDADVACRVASWEEYDRLRAALEETGDFRPGGDKQRMLFRKDRPVDVLPFGAIAGTEERIVWRPRGDTELNVAGFSQAYENAISVRVAVAPELVVKVASVVGLVLMKIFAWLDRKPERKDAADLGLLIRTYMGTGNQERLFEEHEDLLEPEDFDYEVAGARILGRDLAGICSPELRGVLVRELEAELTREGELPLVVHSAASSPAIDKTFVFWKSILDELRATQDSRN